MQRGHGSSKMPRSRAKRIGFRLAACALGLLPFVVVECALLVLDLPAARIDAAIDRDPLVDLHQLQPLFVEADGGGSRRIPAERLNFFQPAEFEIGGGPDLRRIFVVGGSTVQGRPYATQTAFAKLLEVQLAAAFPKMQFQVINCGGVSYASYRVAAIVDEVLTYDPDLIVVYTGHNEFLEARSYDHLRWVPKSAARPLAWLGRLRMVRLVHDRLAAPEPLTTMAAEVDALLDHAGGLEAYRRDPPWREQVERHFALSLKRMISACQRVDVPLVLCVPASETIETPPFKVTFPGTAPASLRRWGSVVRDPTTSAGDRIEAASRILEHDPQHAGAAYLIGRAAWERGDVATAARYLLNARDHDVCPLRATTEIERTVRRFAEQTGTPSIDTPRLLASTLTERLSAPAKFVDHVHPSIHEGHLPIATALFDVVCQVLAEREGPQSAVAWQRPKLAVSGREAAVRAYLATIPESYYQRGRQRLAGLRNWAAGRAGGQASISRDPSPATSENGDSSDLDCQAADRQLP